MGTLHLSATHIRPEVKLHSSGANMGLPEGHIALSALVMVVNNEI